MKALEDVLSNYLAVKMNYKLVPGANTELPLKALREELPDILYNAIEVLICTEN